MFILGAFIGAMLGMGLMCLLIMSREGDTD